MQADPKELILWAREQGATRVKVGDVEVEFGKPERPHVAMPVKELPKVLQVKDIDGKPVEGVPDYIHAVGCPCDGCKLLFGGSG